MISHIIKGIIWVASIVMLSSSNIVYAVILDAGVDTISRHYVIDATVSNVTYHPHLLESPTEQPKSNVISGEFDVEFSRYWWNYQNYGSDATYTYESNWITFKNADIVDNVSSSGFNFPSFFVQVDGNQFGGDNSACSGPSSPETYCTGSTLAGSTSQLTGQIKNMDITFSGSSPFGDSLLSYYSYDISASAVPLPGSFLLLFSGLFFIKVLGFKSEYL